MSHRRDNRPPADQQDDGDDRVRLDKWLWAARFFKTRALAAEAVAGGKVEVNEEPAKRARPLRIGDRVRVRLGPYLHHVTVMGLSAKRGPAATAATLYQETPASREARERLAWQLRNAPAITFDQEKGRPTKKDRREIERLRGQ